MFNVAELIERKRDGHPLNQREIEFLIDGYTRGEVPDYQIAAWAMAVYFRGLTRTETTHLTEAMVATGERLRWSSGKPKVDKHSTGGIGDKISIPLAPLLAVCGVDVPMISGRGLGATGGTLDKLESIAGYRTDLSLDRFRDVVQRVGCSIIGASPNLVPADQKKYALRDVTGTVPSIPLITASILSKKLAEGLDTLLLDVKWGSGAFMTTLEQARELAQSLVAVAREVGLRTSAVITDMNQPLGRMIGNAVEIDESIDVLQGKGPADVTTLTLELGARLLVLTGIASDRAEGLGRMQRAIDDGSGLEKLHEMVRAHGGDLNQPRRRGRKFAAASLESGFVAAIDARRIGIAIIEMGGGRRIIGDPIDHSAGIEFLVGIGDKIDVGQPIAHIYCDSQERAEFAAQITSAALRIEPSPVAAPPLIVEEFGEGSVT